MQQAILAQRAGVLKSLAALVATLPSNRAGEFGEDQLQKIFSQMYNDFIWPQVTARLPFEEKWDNLKRMYEVKKDPKRNPRQKQSPENQTIDTGKDAPIELSDTIIFDTVDRLKNLNYFIAWKDAPVQFNRPQYYSTPLEDEFYNPTTRKLKGANAILDWNNGVQNVKAKHLALAQHHYLYGCSFVFSDFVFEIEEDNGSDEYLLIKNIGTTFEPVNVRRLWLNMQIPIDQMEQQICPFFFELQTRGNVLQNQYNPNLNPFGFLNLDKLQSAAYLFGPEAKAFTDGLSADAKNIQTQMKPEFSGEALWTFFPYLTLPGDKQMKRYIVQAYANNLFSGNIIPLRIQEIYHPRKRLPFYGCNHIPDLDSGLYPPSIGEILSSHYDELVRAKEQFLLNKDWINNPPTETLSGSPAANNKNINRPGVTYEVTGLNDVTRRQPFDATSTTIAFIDQTRESAQTSGKAVDAILGKAMGGRTTATEASNAFQASMSGVTADLDHFCSQIFGQYGIRVWENSGKWIPADILRRICGAVDAPPLSDQDFLIQIGVKTDVGSSFIESVVKQQHLQQAILSSTTSPYLDGALLWKALANELKMPSILEAIKDNGFELQVQFAYQQAVDTYMGKPIAIDPSQDHNIAIRVKTRFLQDTQSEYNLQFAANPSPQPGLTVTQYLAQQIQIHQQFVMLQQKQQMMMMAAQMHDEQTARIGDQQHQIQLKRTVTPVNNGQQQAGQPTQQPQPSPNQ